MKNRPPHARTVRYCYGRYRGEIDVWRSTSPGPEKWYWAALGNEGETQGNMWDAVNAAREWIVNSNMKKEEN